MTDLSKAVLAAPKYNNDLVLWADTVSFDIPATAAGQRPTRTYTIPGMNQFTRPMGIFTIDGGASYNDIGEFEPTYASGTGFYPTTIMPAVTCNLLTLAQPDQTFQFEISRTTTTTTTVTISFVLLAIDAPSTLDKATYTFKGGTTSYTSKSLFRKIAQAAAVTPNGVGAVVPHNQGKVPMVQAWINNSNGNSVGGFYNDPAFPGGGNGYSLKMDAQNLYLGAPAGGQILYRVYYEN